MIKEIEFTFNHQPALNNWNVHMPPRLGNCPQFDTVWRAQSVKAHLEFYARLKGVDEPEKGETSSSYLLHSLVEYQY